MVQFTRTGITPALILQMLYYEQLSDIDPFFEQRLNRLRDMVLEQERKVSSGMDVEFRKESVELLQHQELGASRQLSTIESKIPSIPVDVFQYRFIDETQTPILVTFIESSPREAFLIDWSRNRNESVSLNAIQNAENIASLLPQYELQHSLQTYNENWELTGRKQKARQFKLRESVSGRCIIGISCQNIQDRAQRSASSEIMNTDETTAGPAFDTPYPKTFADLEAFIIANPLRFRPIRIHFRLPTWFWVTASAMMIFLTILYFRFMLPTAKQCPGRRHLHSILKCTI